MNIQPTKCIYCKSGEIARNPGFFCRECNKNIPTKDLYRFRYNWIKENDPDRFDTIREKTNKKERERHQKLISTEEGKQLYHDKLKEKYRKLKDDPIKWQEYLANDRYYARLRKQTKRLSYYEINKIRKKLKPLYENGKKVSYIAWSPDVKMWLYKGVFYQSLTLAKEAKRKAHREGRDKRLINLKKQKLHENKVKEFSKIFRQYALKCQLDYDEALSKFCELRSYNEDDIFDYLNEEIQADIAQFKQIKKDMELYIHANQFADKILSGEIESNVSIQ